MEEGRQWLREHPEAFERGNDMGGDDNNKSMAPAGGGIWATLLTLGLNAAWKWWKNRKGKA